MSAKNSAVLVLRKQVIDYLRSQFTPAEVVTIAPYGGRFTEEEIAAKSFLSPAIFVVALGWQPVADGRRMSGRFVRRVFMAAFVVTKAVERETRGDEALALSDQVAELLRQWHPDITGLDVSIGPLEDDPEVENLYSRKADEIGVARWLVKWDQTVKGAWRRKAAPLYPLTSVEITDTVSGSVTPDAGGTSDLQVTEEIVFTQVDPIN